MKTYSAYIVGRLVMVNFDPAPGRLGHLATIGPFPTEAMAEAFVGALR